MKDEVYIKMTFVECGDLLDRLREKIKIIDEEFDLKIGEVMILHSSIDNIEAMLEMIEDGDE